MGEREGFRLPLLDEQPGEESKDGDKNQRAPVCRLLRTKMSFGSFAWPHPTDEWGDSTTAVYWCLQTMESFGADDDYVHPHKCISGRRCFSIAQVV